MTIYRYRTVAGCLIENTNCPLMCVLATHIGSYVLVADDLINVGTYPIACLALSPRTANRSQTFDLCVISLDMNA